MGSAMSPAMPKRLPLFHLVPTLGQKYFPELQNPPSFSLSLIFPSAVDFPGCSENNLESKLYDQIHVSNVGEAIF